MKFVDFGVALRCKEFCLFEDKECDFIGGVLVGDEMPRLRVKYFWGEFGIMLARAAAINKKTASRGESMVDCFRFHTNFTKISRNVI